MKSKILNSARKLFLEKGYNKTTLKDIVKDAETSVGNCYFYYKNKEKILEAIIDSRAEKIDQYAYGILEKYQINDLVKRIATVIFIHSTYVLDQEETIKLYLMGSSFPEIRKIASARIEAHIKDLEEFDNCDCRSDEIFGIKYKEYDDIFPILYKSVFIGLVESFHLDEIDRTMDEMRVFMIRWVLSSIGVSQKEISDTISFVKTININFENLF